MTIPKDIEEILAKMTPEARREFWEFALEKTRAFLAMSKEEQKRELKDAGERAVLIEHRLKLLEMKPEERAAELKKLSEEAEKLKTQSEKEWEEAVEISWQFLANDELAYRKEETEAAKGVPAEKTNELIENFKTFLAKDDLAGCGAILRKLAASGRVSELLNYYGYQSDILSVHQFFNEVVIGKKSIIGDKAFDNFLFQQKAYLIEHDISCLTQGLSQWSLAFAVGKKARAWYQLDEREHLLVVAEVIKKIKPGVAARRFGALSYGSQVPMEKFNFEAGSIFELGREGKLILMFFADSFEKQLAKKEFNPEAAEALYDVVDELEAIGVKPTFIEALGKYVEGLKSKPEMAEEVEEEFEK